MLSPQQKRMRKNLRKHQRKRVGFDTSSVDKALFIDGALHLSVDLNRVGQCGMKIYGNHESFQNSTNKYCKFIQERGPVNEEIIYSLHGNIRTKETYSHFYKTRSLLAWARTINLQEPDVDEDKVAKLFVSFGGYNYEFEEEVFSVGYRTKVFITESLLLWVIRKNIVDKIGYGMYKLYINDK